MTNFVEEDSITIFLAESGYRRWAVWKRVFAFSKQRWARSWRPRLRYRPTASVVGRSREAERDAIRREIAVIDRAGKRAQVDVRTIERDLRARLETWRGLLRKHVPQARQVLRKLLDGPIVFRPMREDGERYCAFTAPIDLALLLTGTASANMVASPTGLSKSDEPPRVGGPLRRAA